MWTQRMGVAKDAPRLKAIHRIVTSLSRMPRVFEGLRWGLEGGFYYHRDLLRRHFPNPDVRVLDCGCGTGIYARHFSQKGYVGIDVSEEYLQRARNCNPGYFFTKMDATNLAFDAFSFDAVITSGVIHHLGDEHAKQVLFEIRRVLKPTGLFLLWEDIPTRSRFNLMGMAVHHFDLGGFIRSSSQYVALLEGFFSTETVEQFCSGFMDYAAFRCRPISFGMKVCT
jgi:ubiquinone/menaquinone biosynthesis C-methylase UbiE